jgi:transmembrane sensor
MKNTLPEYIFERYAAGNCTEEEKALVDAWYLAQLKEDKYRPSESKIQAAKEEAWKIIMPSTKIKDARYSWSIAAAILVGLLFVFLFRASNDPKPKSPALTQAKKVELPVSKGTVLSASKVENSMMKLPDGSTVILEKGTTLTLSADFNKSQTREVELIGKAFFDIQHNPKKPFIIHSGTVNTTVLGTAFDITSRKGSHRVKVNVIRGRVRVEDRARQWVTILPKNYQVEYFEKEEPRKTAVDAEKELAWNRSDLEFNDISVGDAQSRLESQFGYKIAITDASLKNTTFTYSMRRKETTESFIKAICAFIGASYTIDYKDKIISIQPLNQ